MNNVTQYEKDVGERARHIRQILSMNQSEVSKLLGVTRQTLNNYESGRTPMRVGALRRLCDVYRVSPEWILGFTDDLFIKRKEGNGTMMELHEVSKSIGGIE